MDGIDSLSDQDARTSEYRDEPARTCVQYETRDQPAGGRVANRDHPGVADLFVPKTTVSALHTSSQERSKVQSYNKFIELMPEQDQPKTPTFWLKSNQAPFVARLPVFAHPRPGADLGVLPVLIFLILDVVTYKPDSDCEFNIYFTAFYSPHLFP